MINFADLDDSDSDEDLELSNHIINYFSTGSPGECIVYRKSIKNFIIIRHDQPIYDNDIIIGVILDQLKNNELVVLLKNFITNDTVNIPIDMLINKKYLPFYTKTIIERYIKTYKKRMPPIKKLQRINLNIIPLEYIDIVLQPHIKEGFIKLIGNEKTKEFYQKILTTSIYTIYNRKIKQWEYSQKKYDPEQMDSCLHDVSICGAEILPIAIIKIFKKQGNN